MDKIFLSDGYVQSFFSAEGERSRPAVTAPGRSNSCLKPRVQHYAEPANLCRERCFGLNRPRNQCSLGTAPGKFHKRSQEKNTSPLAGVFLAVQPTWLSRFVLAFRSGSSGRHYRCVALLVFFISVFHRLCATKPIGSETNKAATRLSGANHGSIGDSWPIAFSGGARGTRVA
jgi:hypothetical protein